MNILEDHPVPDTIEEPPVAATFQLQAETPSSTVTPTSHPPEPA